MKPLLRWWDRLTTPPAPPGPSPLQREHARQARFLSRLVLTILLLSSTNTVLLLIAQDISSALVTLGTMGILLCVLFFNRLGQRTLAGSCCVLCVLFANTVPVVMAGTVDISVLLSLNFLGLAVIIAGALITPAAAFVVAAITSSILVGCMAFLPHSPALDSFFLGNVTSVVLPPIILQTLLGAITFFVVRDLLRALKRADRAEELMVLQREIAQHEHVRAQEKQHLEEGIKHIAQVHARVAKGHLEARVSVTEGTVLWAVAGPLNNLLSRAQRWKQERDLLEQDLKLLQQERAHLEASSKSLKKTTEV